MSKNRTEISIVFIASHQETHLRVGTVFRPPNHWKGQGPKTYIIIRTKPRFSVRIINYKNRRRTLSFSCSTGRQKQFLITSRYLKTITVLLCSLTNGCFPSFFVNGKQKLRNTHAKTTTDILIKICVYSGVAGVAHPAEAPPPKC